MKPIRPTTEMKYNHMLLKHQLWTAVLSFMIYPNTKVAMTCIVSKA